MILLAFKTGLLQEEGELVFCLGDGLMFTKLPGRTPLQPNVRGATLGPICVAGSQLDCEVFGELAHPTGMQF